MKRTLLTLALATGLVTAGAASAQRYYGSDYDYARVVDVDPIYDYGRRPVSREVCYDQPVNYYSSGSPGYYRGGSSSVVPTIAGAVVGGLLGNQVGSGSGRDAATVAGALIGGTVGNRVARRDAYGNTYYETYPSSRYNTRVERRCQIETTYAGTGSRRPVGYDVTYVYDGRTYRTRTATHPGRNIRVEVDRLDGYAYRY
jgi:uncharacterized protein YcfJ